MIQRIQAETGTTVTIEEKDGGVGHVEILGTSPKGMEDAIAMIKMIAFDPEIGQGIRRYGNGCTRFRRHSRTRPEPRCNAPYFGTRLAWIMPKITFMWEIK